jgi:methylenetetrahydrofolate reductase (NADPH)
MSVSVEFFPPKDALGEARLWEAMAGLGKLSPNFISVTYGAGGSTRDRTIRITKEITEHTGIATVAHLTCVGSTKVELVQVLNDYKSVGISNILALRGDPTGGPSSPWVGTSGGLDHADQLVELAVEHGGFQVGVAAFPDGHPASEGNLTKDIDVLIRKEERGATFATTQFFFDAKKWLALVEKLDSRGSKLPVIAGVLPITNVKQLKRMAELTGTPIPAALEDRFGSISDNPDEVRKLGVEIATQFCAELIEADVPGLHFYTMNTATATMEIAANLGLLNRA